MRLPTPWTLIRMAAILAICLVTGVASATSLPDTIDQMRGSIVAVGTMRPVKSTRGKGPPLKFMGTGFVVGNGQQIITNLHVLPAKMDVDSGEVLAIFAGRGESAKATPARIKAVDAVHDLALLELEGRGLKPLSLAGDAYVREGSDVAFTGFPIGMILGLYPVTHRAMVSAITPFVIPAHSTATLTPEQIKRLRHPFEVYQLDAGAYPGSSGSPLYDVRTGKVLGVLNSVFVQKSKESLLPQPSGIAYAIPVRHVNKLMSDNP
ncbi:S1 family peptidase [Pseudomaricurvus sp.]|uniref:S1 family peptidase n=1 Tax=Pseudomaricurvus sp. TaxID=2004510 RepID=UPI003F6C2E94